MDVGDGQRTGPKWSRPSIYNVIFLISLDGVYLPCMGSNDVLVRIAIATKNMINRIYHYWLWNIKARELYTCSG